MKIIIEADAKEIAALVLELQGRQDGSLPNYIPLAESIRQAVMETKAVHIQGKQVARFCRHGQQKEGSS